MTRLAEVALLSSATPRLAVRAILLHEERLLLVNAWSGEQSTLWCAPGGGVERGQSLPATLVREVHEECGLEITVGLPCLVNEFHDPDRGFHQVEVFFRCQLADGTGPEIPKNWRDPERVVNRHRWVTREELGEDGDVWAKPDSLSSIAWQEGVAYDPLERLVR